MSEGGDLAFRVTKDSGLNKEEEVMTMTRVPSNKEIQSGHLLLRPATTATLVFDNTFSVLR